MQESTKDSIMNGYRFHLQKYRPGSKTACPECGRKSCFTRYIDEAGEISFPATWVSVTISTVAATTILRKNTSGIIRPSRRG